MRNERSTHDDDGQSRSEPIDLACGGSCSSRSAHRSRRRRRACCSAPCAAARRSSSAAAQSPAALKPLEGDYVIPNFRFASGEALPELRLHFTTFGKAASR